MKRLGTSVLNVGKGVLSAVILFSFLCMYSCSGGSDQKRLFDFAVENDGLTPCKLISFPEWDGKPILEGAKEVIVEVQNQRPKLWFMDIPKMMEIPPGTEVYVITRPTQTNMLVLACIPAELLEKGKKDFNIIKDYFITNEESLKEIMNVISEQQKSK